MTRALHDPRPVVLGAAASFAFGFATVTALLCAGLAVARRWTR